MAKIQLKEICSFSKGCQINGDELLENGEYDYLNGGINPSGKWNEYNVSGNTVTISEGGNSSGYVNYMPNPFWCGAHCYYLYELKCDVKYLYYALKSQQDKIMKLRSGACMPNIKKSDIGKFEFEYSSDTNVQKQIAANLDKVTHTIDLCNNILEKLDLLVKARFVEMFGDPVTNPHKWEKVNISTVVGGKVSNGFFAKRDEYCDNGNVKVLGVANIVNRMYSNTEELPQTNGSNADIEKYGVKYGDMLFCRSSLVATGIGKASIVPKEVPSNVLFECHIIRLPLNLTKCVPEFVQVLSTTDYFRNQVISQSKTATMTTISQDGILKSEIILPPLELQKQFLMFVEQTNKSKSAVKQVLEKAETLKKALMQEYFG